MKIFGFHIVLDETMRKNEMRAVSAESSLVVRDSQLAHVQKERDRIAGEMAAMAANASADGPRAELAASDNAQAARAMSRNTKNDFREYQSAVKNVLSQFDKVMSKNSITKKDLDTVNSVREQMRAIVRREI